MDQQNMVQAKDNIMLPTVNPVTLDNQVPYTNQVPDQPTTTPDTPLLDLRNGVPSSGTPSTAIQVSTTNLNPSTPLTQTANANPNTAANASAAINSAKVTGPVKTWSNPNGVMVEQTAPNAVAIMNN
jgi:hypothetical protein